jgi:VWFA-related protein
MKNPGHVRWCIRALALESILLGVLSSSFLLAQAAPQGQQSDPNVPSLRVTTSLVFLDVTVVDRSGRPVSTELTKNDFQITEAGKPQRIFSFEPSEIHKMAPDSKEDDPNGTAPATIFVLDRLNSAIDDFQRGRLALHAYLATQPDTLDSPAELLVLGNNSLEMVQGYTRSKADLMSAVDEVQPEVPYKLAHPDFNGERAHESISALIEIAVQNTGIPGRKNIFWVGPGGPSLTRAAYGPILDAWKPFVHRTVDLLVDSRVSLFVVFPVLQVAESSLTLGSPDADDRSSNIGNNRVSTGDVNFALIARQTGGALFYNRNDIDGEIGESRQLGAHYYTLTYQSTNHNLDGKYRPITVKLRIPELRAITKQGYYALDRNGPMDPQQQVVSNITHAASSSLPFNALSVRVSDVDRQPALHSAQFTIHIQPKNLGWVQIANGKKVANLIMGVTSLSGSKKILAWKFEKLDLQSTAEKPDELKAELRARLTARVPPKTRTIRVVLETADGGRIGTADIDRGTLDSAPVESAPAHSSTPSSANPAHGSAPNPIGQQSSNRVGPAINPAQS